MQNIRKRAQKKQRSNANAVSFFLALAALVFLGDVAKFSESGGIIYSQFSQHLAIHLDAGILQAVHHTAVGQAVHTSGGIDTHDPQATEISLAETTAGVGVGKGLHNGFSSRTILLGLGAKITFGKLEDFAALLQSVDCSFNSSHFLFSLSLRISPGSA